MKSSDNLNYISGIDGLRAISLILVLLAHWVPFPNLTEYFDTGRIGLVTFFVISGFLITRILINLKERVKKKEISIVYAFKEFYLRRAFRIFPIYYLAIVLALIVGYNKVGRDIWWHLTFLANFSGGFLAPQGAYEPIAPLWSLCVEEQFYLLWAPCILLLSNRKIWRVAFALILVAFTWRTFGGFYIQSPFALILSTPANVDSLAAGILVAIAISHNLNEKRHFNSFVFLLGIVGFIAFIMATLEKLAVPSWKPWYDAAYYLPTASLIFFLVIGKVPKAIVSFLELAPIKYLGERSYGFYVYHQIVNFGFIQIYYKFIYGYYTSFVLQNHTIPGSIVFFILTLIVSVVSFSIVERPLLNLRKKYSLVNNLPVNKFRETGPNMAE